MSLEHLKACIADQTHEHYPAHSRVHKLRMAERYGVDCYVKREDELGCVISGSKNRKYRSLVANLKKAGCQKAALIGSHYSNHILGLSSLLIENQIAPELFLLKASDKPPVGNAFFTQLLVEESHIHFIDRASWLQVHQIASEWQRNERNAVVIEEGGSVSDCLPGLITLAIDIQENEKALGNSFKHLLVDAGSGVTAVSLLACLGYLKKQVHVHVLLAAGTPAAFTEKLEEARSALEAIVGEPIVHLPPFTIYNPASAKSFGATSSAIFKKIGYVARTEGFFLDPIYSVKLYELLEKLLEERLLSSPVLFIHSGGLFTLSGFQDKLRPFL